MNKIENLVWNLTGNLPEQINKNLDSKDKKFYKQYNDLINKYSKMLSFSDMDITKDYLPPKDLYVEVRALENLNKIKTQEGDVKIVKNHTYSFRRSDVEHYLRAGLFVLNE